MYRSSEILYKFFFLPTCTAIQAQLKSPSAEQRDLWYWFLQWKSFSPSAEVYRQSSGSQQLLFRRAPFVQDHTRWSTSSKDAVKCDRSSLTCDLSPESAEQLLEKTFEIRNQVAKQIDDFIGFFIDCFGSTCFPIWTSHWSNCAVWVFYECKIKALPKIILKSSQVRTRSMNRLQKDCWMFSSRIVCVLTHVHRPKKVHKFHRVMVNIKL